MDEDAVDPSIVDELYEYLSGEMPDDEAPPFLLYLRAEPELLAKSRSAANAIDDVEKFIRGLRSQVPIPVGSGTTSEEPARSWHQHRRSHASVRSLCYRMYPRNKRGVPLRKGGARPWTPLTDVGMIHLKEAASLEVLLEADSVPSLRLHLMEAGTGTDYWGEIELVDDKLITTFDLVEPGTYKVELIPIETESAQD